MWNNPYDIFDNAFELYDVESFEFYPGDNSGSVTLEPGPAGNGNDKSSFSFYYTYTERGTYSPTVRVSYYPYASSGLKTESYSCARANVFDACSSVNVHNLDWVDDGAKGMAYKVWYTNDLFGKHAGTYTHGYHWRPSKNKWKRHNGSISASIDASFRNGENECTINENKSETDHKSSGKRVRAVVTKHGKADISEGDVYSTNMFSKDGHFLSKSLILDVCQ